MNSNTKIKKIVQKKYGAIVSKKTSTSCCCGSGCCSAEGEISNFSDNYTGLDGYVKDADFGLGCGLPTKFANIKKGDTVVDLGSGAGNDAFICSKIVGKSGKVIGIDMTEEMVKKALKNAKKYNFSNVEFKLGDIENLPLENNTADVIVSNCVLNLVPDKKKAFSEIYRVLKKGGHFCISDVVLTKKLPLKIKKAAELYTGCISGAILLDEYIYIIKSQGFKNTNIPKRKNIPLGEKELKSILKNDFKKNDYSNLTDAVLSVTITAEKL
ncbi:arsenite methyltransferase [Candidatus Dependentiae bacterium]|nr:arsenite methyltransferase [Candidatus Dependentiae bacterium]